MSFVVVKSVRRFAGEFDVNVAGGFCEALDKAVETLLVRAVEKSKANGRKTLRPCDL